MFLIFPSHFLFGNYKFVFYAYEFISVLYIDSFVLFFIPHISDATYYLSFSVWLTSLSMIISRSIHVVANGIISFFFMANIPLCIYTIV